MNRPSIKWNLQHGSWTLSSMLGEMILATQYLTTAVASVYNSEMRLFVSLKRSETVHLLPTPLTSVHCNVWYLASIQRLSFTTHGGIDVTSRFSFHCRRTSCTGDILSWSTFHTWSSSSAYTSSRSRSYSWSYSLLSISYIKCHLMIVICILVTRIWPTSCRIRIFSIAVSYTVMRKGVILSNIVAYHGCFLLYNCFIWKTRFMLLVVIDAVIKLAVIDSHLL